MTTDDVVLPLHSMSFVDTEYVSVPETHVIKI